jgi:hypothetical protein
MQATSLTALAEEQLTAARTASSGRSAQTIVGGHDRALRQTLIALAEGQRGTYAGEAGTSTAAKECCPPVTN